MRRRLGTMFGLLLGAVATVSLMGCGKGKEQSALETAAPPVSPAVARPETGAGKVQPPRPRSIDDVGPASRR